MQRNGLAVLGCLAAVLLIGALVAPVTATAQDDGDEFPRAEAGLDQTVERNASVLLDASQSYSPDGQLVEYTWEITTPSGATISPNCDSADCSLARFRVPELGQYDVTLTVTDDDGRQLSDTLYVTVVPRGDFGVELTGPDATGQEGNLTTTVTPGEVRVRNVTWYRSGRSIGNRSLPALGGTVNETADIVPGAVYRAVVNGSWNRTVADTWTAPGGGSWTPATSDAGNYPRIEGPALVTGEPDQMNGDTWRYDRTHYVLRTNQFGSVRQTTWQIEGSRVAPDWVNRDESRVAPPMEPGVNVLTADAEIARGEGFQKSSEEVNTTNPTYYETLNVSEMLTRRILVDPAPQIQVFDAWEDDSSVGITYSGEDRYNPAEKIHITVAGTTMYSSDSRGGSFSDRGSIEIPPNTYGETTVRLQIVDGRGQVATAQETVTLSKPSQEMQHQSPLYQEPVEGQEGAVKVINNETGRVLLIEQS